MKQENAIKQADLLMQLMNKLSSISTEMFETCQKQCEGKKTSEANEYYNKEFKDTNETLYNVLKDVAQRYYELTHMNE